ncbi:anaerobic sulfatase maturase [Rhodobacter sp. CZR27]|uniref:anaerobic sulfatase maturase n=1 Tax=Rhodobacter sp. CZR27 TaxID=2033869 RepID=UPI000BBE6779|nr:anaerobic sulfatase maturase [Rhodobacter sp. CZR27]
MAKPIGPRCNLDCGYCYYLEKQALYPERHRFRMEEAVLSRFIRDYIASQSAAGQREITFAWQGGEPMLMGLDYFRRVVEIQARHCPPGHRIGNALQTNGTLVTEDWARFLRENGFLVGVSLDGPPAMHDQARPDRRGRPSSAAVLRGLERLQRHGVDVNILTVISRANVGAPLEVYRYLRGLGAEVIQFIPALERLMPDGRLAGPPGRGDRGAVVAPFCASGEELGRFLCAVFDEWVRHDVGRVFVQHFDVMLGLWMGEPASLCIFAETCGTALALEHDGGLYACDHYVYPEHRLGSLLARPVAELAALPRQRRFGKDKAATLPPGCRTCRWRFACNGGCPKHRILPDPTGGPGRINHFCDGYRMFLDHAAPAFDRMAELLRAGLPASAIIATGARPA